MLATLEHELIEKYNWMELILIERSAWNLIREFRGINEN